MMSPELESEVLSTVHVRPSSQNQSEYVLTRDHTCRKKLVLGFRLKWVGIKSVGPFQPESKFSRESDQCRSTNLKEPNQRTFS
jgi:hypothetical protein